jgi:hypothetical protein
MALICRSPSSMSAWALILFATAFAPSFAGRVCQVVEKFSASSAGIVM